MNTFLISDTHFSHENILKFKRSDGLVLRNFTNIHEMDETIIRNWNDTVRPGDKVYHLGDVAFCSNSRLAETLERLNGTKILIKGNHDNRTKLSFYSKYFKDVRAYHHLDDILLAHIPVHPDSLSRWKGQVHGHVHYNSLPDPRYYNVSVEVINYTPVPFETIRKYYDQAL